MARYMRIKAALSALGPSYRATENPGAGASCRADRRDPRHFPIPLIRYLRRSSPASIPRPDKRGATAVIPPKSNRKHQRDNDADIYKWRHMVENYFAKIKEFRGIATRYEKTDCSYAANWNLVATLIASR